MSDERTNEFWVSLERRVSDLDNKMSIIQRDYQRDVDRLSQENAKVSERVNMGLSPSVNKAIQDTAHSELLISQLTNALEKTASEMRKIVTDTADLTKLMLRNFEENKLKPVEAEVGFMKKTFIYGIVGALMVFIGQKALNLAWDKVFKPGIVVVAEPTPLPKKK